jgi:hypothetical protein
MASGGILPANRLTIRSMLRSESIQALRPVTFEPPGVDPREERICEKASGVPNETGTEINT